MHCAQSALAGIITLVGCTAVTLHGPATLTYRMDQYPYAQGTILNVANSYLTYTIQVRRAPILLIEGSEQ